MGWGWGAVGMKTMKLFTEDTSTSKFLNVIGAIILTVKSLAAMKRLHEKRPNLALRAESGFQNSHCMIPLKSR